MNKKLIVAFAAAAVLVGGLSSCGGNGKGGRAEGDTIFSKAASDSLSAAFGETMGYRMLEGFVRNSDSSFVKEEVIKGLEYMLNSDTTKSFRAGMNLGLSIIQQMEQLQAEGIYIDKDKFLENFSKTFKLDKVDEEAMKVSGAAVDSMMEAMTTVSREKLNAGRQNSPEAKKNLAEGEEFMAQLRDSVQGVEIVEEGVFMRVVRPGASPNFDDNTTFVNMTFEESTMAGQVVQSTEGQAFPIDITSEKLPGYIREAIKKVGPGAAFMLYVAGPQAYGVEGIPGLVGPNELIIYKIVVESAE